MKAPTLLEVFRFRLQEGGPTGDRHTRLWDVFSPDRSSYIRSVSGAADRLFGKDWSAKLDSATGRKGAALKFLNDLYDQNYTDHEGLEEIGFHVDTLLQGDVYYSKAGLVAHPKEDMDADRNWAPRTQRPHKKMFAHIRRLSDPEPGDDGTSSP